MKSENEKNPTNTLHIPHAFEKEMGWTFSFYLLRWAENKFKFAHNSKVLQKMINHQKIVANYAVDNKKLQVTRNSFA